MTTAKAHLKQVRIMEEVDEGVAPGPAGAQLLRNVSSQITLKKQAIDSKERRSDLQRADHSHGVRSVEGSLNGEFSPGTYVTPLSHAMRKAWTATADIVGVGITVAGAGPTYTLQRGAGSWITDGIKIGDVVRPTVALNAANLMNLLVVDLTVAAPDTLVVLPVNGDAMVTEGPVAGVTVTVPGKRVWIPETGHTNPSVAVEEWNPGVPDSALWLGNKTQGLTISLPATGNTGFDWSILGIRLATQAQRGGAARTVEYFNAPAAATTSKILQAVNGVMRYGANKVANLTSLSLTYAGNASGEAVVGSNDYPEIDEGPAHWSGQFMVRFDSAQHRDEFEAETECSITVVLRTSDSKTADFVGLTLSRISIDSFDPDDPTVGPIHATVRFTALKNEAGGAATPNEATTIVVQDSLAP